MSKAPNGNETPQVEPQGEDGSDRRGFLTRSGALMAALAASGIAGIEGTAQGQASDEAAALKTVIDAAIANGGNVDRALRGTRLSPENVRVLRSLTRQDWRTAAHLQSSFARVRWGGGRNNNGIIGM